MLTQMAGTVHAQEIPRQSLIRASGPTVYWYSSNGMRYVFPNEKTFLTWFPYHQFDRVHMIQDQALANIRIGGNMTYRPGSRLVKLTTDPKVYAVDARGTLRWLETETVAEALYGPNWRTFIDDMHDAFFTNYTVGATVRRTSDFRPENVLTPEGNL